MKTAHLSAWEQEEYVIDRPTPQMLRHLTECAGCRAAVERLQLGINIFPQRRRGVELGEPGGASPAAANGRREKASRGCSAVGHRLGHPPGASGAACCCLFTCRALDRPTAPRR